LREDAVNFVVLKHRWRWKQVEEEDEMRMAVKREAILLPSQLSLTHEFDTEGPDAGAVD
jgi:hypothetical protein